MAPRVSSVLPLTGDASDRRCFRVLRREEPSVVIALNAEPFDADLLPFVRVAGLFSAMPLPVPAILDRAGDLGLLVLEDLGDVTLQAHLGAAPAAEHNRLYRQAVSFIEAMQRRGAELASPEYPPYGIAFDVEKLLWELEFFTKHYLGAYRGAVIPPPTRTALAAEWRVLAEELAAEPQVLCHRDYHSRNLMLHDGSLHIIDFQDARMGPDTYDMVSLCALVCRSRISGGRADCAFIALKRQRHPAGVPDLERESAVRRDGAAEPGAQDVRLPDERPAESVYINTSHHPPSAESRLQRIRALELAGWR